MVSIRTHTGIVYLCTDCGQPAYSAFAAHRYGPAAHFDEQQGGAVCSRYPLAGELIAVTWEPELLAEIKRCYPDARPSARPAGPAGQICLPALDIDDIHHRYGPGVMFAIAENSATSTCTAIARHLGAQILDWLEAGEDAEPHEPQPARRPRT